MMKKTQLAVAMAAAISGISLAHMSMAQAEVTVTGYLKNETAFGTQSGQYIGEETSTQDNTADHDDVMKFENSARVFMNADVGESSVVHFDINAIYDTQGVGDDNKGHKIYSQHDWLREAYLDTTLSDWYVRLGKQQVVWGTADGIKLLDIINPTDFRELNQNTVEDSRIPLWMVNAERYVGDNGNFQFIISQNSKNKIPGLNANGDHGHPFIMKGVDSITGKVNGFMNVAPALSRVSNSFSLAAAGGFFDADNDDAAADAGDQLATGLNGFTSLTVGGFANNNQPVNNQGQFVTDFVTYAVTNGNAVGGTQAGGTFLNNVAQTPSAVSAALPATNGNNNITNLITATFGSSNPDSAFEYMQNATFATFNTFSGSAAQSGFNSRYEVQKEDAPNFGFRYKANLDSGLNFSVNYAYHWDANPSVRMEWRDSVTQEVLEVQRATQAATGLPDLTSNVGEGDIPNAITTRDNGVVGAPDTAGDGSASNTVSMLLRNDAGQYYGMFDVDGAGAATMSGNRPELVFVETQERVHSIGGSFDMALDSFEIPTVLRGEFLYDKDVMVPVIDKRLLSIGDLTNALRPEKADFFKYVVGVDLTVATNLLISTQFIQFINLDYVEQKRTCTTQDLTLLGGNAGTTFDCSKYTGDPATVHMSNGLNKGEETKEFVSVFLSKPFGAEQQHRWNNITIFEDTGGIWNRVDVEYSFRDNLIGTAEWNYYGGDDDSTFGQLEKSSNVQLGIKYIFD